jgi:hypothetical protein
MFGSNVKAHRIGKQVLEGIVTILIREKRTIYNDSSLW